jgi:hypothetical protein
LSSSKDRSVNNERSIDLAAARRILGNASEDYSDSQIQQVIDSLYTVANIAYHDSNASRNNTRESKELGI